MAGELRVEVTRRFVAGATIAADFQVATPPGTIVVLFGPSGSGKTTVVRAIAGLDPSAHGMVRFNGETWLDTDRRVFVEPQRRNIGCIFQEAALFPHLTVRANIAYGIEHLDAAERVQRVEALLALVELSDHGNRYSRQLSGGQAQRVALARALAPRPRLLLLDEPFAALDVPARSRMRRLLRTSVESLGTSALLVTHDRHEAIALGDQMVVLADGAVRQVGQVLDVFRRPADLRVAQSVGVDAVLPARAERAGNGLVDLRVGGVVLRGVDVGIESRDVFACIRAEDVTLEQTPPAGGSARNHLPGRIVSIDAEGPIERVTVDCGFPLAALITRQAREELGLQPGSPVIAAIKATAIHVVGRA